MKRIKNKFGILGVLVVVIVGGIYEYGEEHIVKNNTNSSIAPELVQVDMNDYKQIAVDPCEISGDRQVNTVVDIGYDSDYSTRDYYGFTNDKAQLFYVHADEIILQNDDEENNGDDRYCNDEAKVEGVEASDLDEGHVIADSLGGVSNAYNITPQDSTLNRHGTQADLEEEMRQALATGKKVTDFNAYIDYSDDSMTPSEYHISYKINGKTREYNFQNQ